MKDFLEASDSELIAHIRQHAETIYHPMSTCAIGKVVDERLEVKGIKGLRVVDASVFPDSVSGHPVRRLCDHIYTYTRAIVLIRPWPFRLLPSLPSRRNSPTCSKLNSPSNPLDFSLDLTSHVGCTIFTSPSRRSLFVKAIKASTKTLT